MERLDLLIGKLREQFEQKATPAQMLVTVQLIETELMNAIRPSTASRSSTKVAVVMPLRQKNNLSEEDIIIFETDEQDLASFGRNVEKKSGGMAEKPVKPGVKSYDPMSEIPTLSQQPGQKELNDIIGTPSSSLNDALREDVQELASSLKETPVKELKKAIGINDRYTFINELFRGDESMYERSIKTINNFRILPEAEYWMERELKIKLGWDDNRAVTKHFYQLVKRRFS